MEITKLKKETREQHENEEWFQARKMHFMSAKSRVDLLLDMETRRKEIQVKEVMENNRYIIKLTLDLCRTMAKQGIAFRGTYRGVYI